MGKALKLATKKAFADQPKLLTAIQELDNKRKDCVFVILCCFLENGGKIEVAPEWWEAATALVQTKGLPIPVIEQTNGLTIDFKHEQIKSCLPDLDEEKRFRNHLKRAQAELERAYALCGKLGMPDTEAEIFTAHQKILTANITYGREVPSMPYESKQPIGFHAIIEEPTEPLSSGVDNP